MLPRKGDGTGLRNLHRKVARMKTSMLHAALRELIAAIAETGMEYPEAHWYVIERFDLSTREGEALTRMYDDCGGVLDS
jgi:hypothetical protein